MFRKNKGLILVLLLAFLVIGSVSVQVFAMSSEPVKEKDVTADAGAVPEGHVRINYHRFDDNYKGWGLHVWNDGYAGSKVEWGSPLPITGKTEYGVYWDVPVSGKEPLNFIIHKGDKKDPDGDRTYPKPSKNKEIWCVSGDITEYTSKKKAEKHLHNKITQALVVGDKKIMVKFRSPIRDLIKVKAGDKTIPVAGLDNKAPTYIVNTKEKLDPKTRYTIISGDMKAKTSLTPDQIDKIYGGYEGELGSLYTPQKTTFKVWSPLAEKVVVKLFKNDKDKNPYKTVDMTKEKEHGVWSAAVNEDLAGQFYQYDVTINGNTRTALDPYAKSMAGFNSNEESIGKGAIVDLDKTDPQGWSNDEYVEVKDQEDVLIYEMSVRDFTIADNSGVAKENRGTYDGFIEKIPHLKELGITHVQLMPVLNWYYGNEFDKSFEDIGSKGEANYNWGYDPHNYFTPEGWFSKDPAKPHLRVKELKRLIKELHDNDIGVMLDVVYNHTAQTFVFENIVPYYYYRHNEDGSLSNGSGCGNVTASERSMMRKLIVDSTKYWVDEYHVDGFRFDLMGLHDEKTMMKLNKEVKEINPDAVIHGEGWNMGILGDEEAYVKGNGDRSLLKYEHAPGMFSDSIRDSIIQPSAFAPAEKGAFIQGVAGNDAKLRAGVVAGMVDYKSDAMITSEKYDRFSDDPEETTTYVTVHDGRTQWDKIKVSAPNATKEQRKRMHKLSSAIILTSQGRSFLHGGVEMLRTKPDPNREHKIAHNSYDSGDLTNQIDWSLKDKHEDIVDYFKGLIELRMNHEAFRMETNKEIQKGINFLNIKENNLIGYTLNEQDGTDPWEEIVVIYNGNKEAKTVNVAGVDSSWKVVVDGENAGVKELKNTEVEVNSGSVKVPAISAVVIHK